MKFLVDLFGGLPVLGEIVKMSYLAARAREVVVNVKLDDKAKEMNATELNKYIEATAQAKYEEHLKAEIDSLGLPESMTKKASEKAIAVIAEELTNRYRKRVS
jgi:tRNA 2-selenouridine synthase SelU